MGYHLTKLQVGGASALSNALRMISILRRAVNQDFFVTPEVVKSGAYKFEKGKLDKLTKEYIQNNSSYRSVCFQSEDGNRIVQHIEKQIQNGVVGFKPLLNGS